MVTYLRIERDTFATKTTRALKERHSRERNEGRKMAKQEEADDDDGFSICGTRINVYVLAARYRYM